MKLVWTARAERDLRDQVDFIARDTIAAAAEVEDRVVEAVAGLIDHPRKGRTSEIVGTRALPIRRTSLLVFYQLTGDTIEVLHVRHMARRPFGETDG